MTAAEINDAVTVIDHPLIHVRLTRLRDRSTSSHEFRERLHEIAQLMVYEITRGFQNKSIEVETPLAKAAGQVPALPIILVPILRAGLGMLNGIMSILPEAQIGHIGMYRDEETLMPKSYYCNLPNNIAEAEVLLIDPMLATGNSSAEAVTQLKAAGAKRLHFISLISCPEGIDHFANTHPDVKIYTAAIDPRLDENGYIYPGLGDAGDRYFGTC